MKDEERERLLVSIQGLAGSIEANLPELLRAMTVVQSTVRAAALTPGGGSGVSDPTGEAVADTLSGDPKDHLDYIDEMLSQALDSLLDASSTAYRYVPERAPIRQGESKCPEGWCTSCWRVDKAHRPADQRYGNRLCSWCGRFRTEYKRLPPFTKAKQENGRVVFSGPLADHVEGRRVTTSAIDEALKPKKATPKKKRRRK